MPYRVHNVAAREPALLRRLDFLSRRRLMLQQRLLFPFLFDDAGNCRLIPAQIIEQQFNAVREGERLDRQSTARRGFIPVGFRFPRGPPQFFRPLPVPIFVDYLWKVFHALILAPEKVYS